MRSLRASKLATSSTSSLRARKLATNEHAQLARAKPRHQQAPPPTHQNHTTSGCAPPTHQKARHHRVDTARTRKHSTSGCVQPVRPTPATSTYVQPAHRTERSALALAEHPHVPPRPQLLICELRNQLQRESKRRQGRWKWASRRRGRTRALLRSDHLPKREDRRPR